jgi:hypothetical protein
VAFLTFRAAENLDSAVDAFYVFLSQVQAGALNAEQAKQQRNVVGLAGLVGVAYNRERHTIELLDPRPKHIRERAMSEQ